MCIGKIEQLTEQPNYDHNKAVKLAKKLNIKIDYDGVKKPDEKPSELSDLLASLHKKLVHRSKIIAFCVKHIDDVEVLREIEEMVNQEPNLKGC